MALIHSYWARLLLNPTESEVALEPAVAALGEPYRFQWPFFGLKHIADFLLVNRKLIIEVDGASHDTPKQKYKDITHTLSLKKLGYEVIRVTNEQAKRDPEGTVKAALAASPQTTEQLEAALARLLRDYPELPEQVARKSKRPKRPKKAKPAAGKSGAAPRKPTAP